MTERFLDILKGIYSSSNVKTVLADKDFNIRWINDVQMLKQHDAKNALCLFETGSKIPPVSGTYVGILDGTSYNYNIIRCESGGEVAFIIEILSRDTLMDTLKIPAVTNYVAGFDANIRQAVFGIATASSNIYDVFEATESYNEINIINAQMRACYKILKSMMRPNEILKYIYDIMDVQVISLSRFLFEAQTVFDQILDDKKTYITLEAEEGLFVRADEERMQYMLIDTILYIIKHNEGTPSIRLNAKMLAGDVLLSISSGDCASDQISDDFCSYTQENSLIQAESPYSTELDLYIVNLFCNRFKGKLYVVSGGRDENAVGIRLPAAKESEFLPGQSLKTAFRKYDSDRFSPYYIGLADIYSYDFYE